MQQKWDYDFTQSSGLVITQLQNFSCFEMGSDSSVEQKASTKKQLSDQSKPGLRYGLAAMKGWRNFMEDSHLSIMNFNNDPELDLFGIFDGHAGCEVAILVQRLFPVELAKNSHFIAKNYPRALEETFLKMDEILASDSGAKELRKIIQEESQKDNCYDLNGGESEAGCTALVCLCTKDTIFVANTGDCKAIAGFNSDFEVLNAEHRPSLESQAQRIKAAGGFIENGRIGGDINVSRCIGDFQYKSNKNLNRRSQMIICDPQIKEISRERLKYILMGCDGIWESKSPKQMNQWIGHLKEKAKLSEKLAMLLDEELGKDAKGFNGMDNMSAILIHFQ